MENINYKSVLKDKEKMKKIEVKQSDFDKILVKIANKINVYLSSISL